MALLKTIELPSGSTAEYHNIPTCSKSFRPKFIPSPPVEGQAPTAIPTLIYAGKIKFVNVTVSSFVNAAAREAGKPAVNSTSYQIEETDPSFDTFFNDEALAAEGMTLEKACYNYLKTVEPFIGATNHP